MRIKTIPIFAAFFIMGFGDAVGTLVGFVQEEFAISPAMAGLLPFAGFLAYGIFSVPFGILGEKWGKKAILLMSLGVVLVGELIPVISIARYVYVLIAIFLIGMGMTGLQVAGNPMMRDVSAPGNYSRNLTFAQFIKSIGSNTAPYVVPLVVALGLAWEAIFSIYALVAAATILAVAALRTGETEEREGGDAAETARPASVRTSFALLKDPYVAAMVGAIFLYVGAEVGMNSWIATYLQGRFGFDIQSMATLGIGFFLTSLAAGRLLGSIVLNFLSPRRFFVITSVLATLGIAGMVLPAQGLVIASIFLAGLAFGNIFPLIFSIAIDDMPHRSSELSGLMVMAIVGGAIVPSLMGLVADASVTLTFVIPLAIFVYITLLALRVASGGPGDGDAQAAAAGRALRAVGAGVKDFLGLSAEGTNFVFGAVRGGEEVADPVTLPARGEDLEASLANIRKGFEEVRAAVDGEPAAISFAFPGPADYRAGIIGDLANLPGYRGGVPLGPMLSEHFGVPVYINNDGDLFTYGEAMAGLLPWVNRLLEQAGSERHYGNLLGLTLGTGFGGGMVYDGRLVLGDNSAAGEIWSMRSGTDPELNAEEGASIRGVRRSYAGRTGLDLDEVPDPETLFLVAKGHEEGDAEAAREAFFELGRTVGEAAANAAILLDGLVVIGGGLAGASELFLPEVVARMNGSYPRPGGGTNPRMESTAYDLEDEEGRAAFLASTSRQIPVPGTDRTVTYQPEKKVGVGTTRLGTSRAVSIGAYAFALDALDASEDPGS